MTKYCFCLLLMIGCFFSTASFAQQQDITGLWNGELVFNDTANNEVHLPYEIAVSEEKGKLTGYSRIVFHANGKDEAGIEGITLKWKGKELIIEDEGFIAQEFTEKFSKRVKKTMILTLDVTSTEMTLSGTWSTNRTRQYPVSTKGTSVLKRKAEFKTSALIKSLDTLKLADKLSFANQPITATVAAAPPVETPKPTPPVVAEPEPELIIPPIPKIAVAKLVTEAKAKPSAARIAVPSRQKRMQMDLLTKMYIKAPPKPEPPAVVARPEPVVAAATPEKKTPPVATPKPAPPPVVVTKPAEPAVKPAPPKPTPPPVAIVAPSITKGAAEIEKRTTKSDQSSVYFDSDSLTLTLYDNGEVDGDTVTVLMNGNIIFSKVGLSTTANTKTIYTNNIQGDSVSLVMYAESLGSIPPNTGLMIIMDGEKRYEVRFSADLKTNAGFVLRRRKNE